MVLPAGPTTGSWRIAAGRIGAGRVAIAAGRVASGAAAAGLAVLLWSAGAAAQEPSGPDSAGADAPSGPPPYVVEALDVTVASRAGAGLGAATRSVDVLTAREIDRIPARSVGDLLRWAMGVEVRSRSAAQADLSLRGSSFEQVLVLVDGVPMNDAQTAHFDLDLAVPLESVERIEVIRGPASALYGADALGGVVNIVTSGAAGAPGLAAARLEAGSFGRAGALVSGRTPVGGSSLFGAAEVRRSDGHRPGTDSRIAKASLRGSRPVGGGRLRADLGFALRDFGANGFYSPFDSYEETRTFTASARWAPGRGAGGVRVEPRASFRLHDDDFILVRGEPELYRNRHTSWQAGGGITFRARPASRLALAWGGELYRDALDSNALGRREETRGAVYAEAAVGETDGLVVTSGLRLDWHEVYGSELSPSATAALWPADALKLRASVGRSFRTPSWTERFLESPANVGSSDLEPETAWSGEVGAELIPADGLHLGVTGFLRDARELIDWSRPAAADPEATPWRTRNVESARYRGLEAEAEARGPGGLRLHAGLELLSVEADASRGFVSKRALRPLAEKLRIQAGRSLSPGVRADLRWMRAVRRGGEEPYHRLGARVSWRLGRTILYVEGTNLTDDAYPDITGHPAPGRAVTAGLTWGGAGRR